MTKFVERPATKNGIAHRNLICGVGINDADYSVRKKAGEQSCPYYSAWKSMLNRCYNSKVHVGLPTYKGCTVAEEWKVFTIFRKWMETQPWKGNFLDKDIRFPGNKIYSEETCCFIPHSVNTLISYHENERGKLPLGVFHAESKGKYRAKCRLNGKTKWLGTFKTPEEAHQAYVVFKTKLIIEAANKQTNQGIKQGLLKHAALLT